MLDPGYIRTNLEKVKAKLCARGADPGALLGDFETLDMRRRGAITASEAKRARLNERSQRVGALKKAGEHEKAAVIQEENRALKVEIDELGQRAAEYDQRIFQVLAGI